MAQTGWRDPTKLGGFVRLMQWPLGVVSVALLLTDLRVIGAAAGLPPTMGETEPGASGLYGAVMTNGLVSLLSTALLVVAAVASLMWIIRTNRNAHTLAEGLRVSPGWAAGWFFVPIASFFKPFQGVNDTWRISEDPQGWADRPAPALLRVWWALFLVESVVGNLVGRLSIAAHTVQEEQVVAVLSLVLDATGVASAVVFWRVVKGLDRLQSARNLPVQDHLPPAAATA